MIEYFNVKYFKSITEFHQKVSNYRFTPLQSMLTNESKFTSFAHLLFISIS